MVSLTSLVNVGSVNMLSLGNFEGSVSLLKGVYFPRSSRRFSSYKHSKYVDVCRYKVTDNYTDTFFRASPKKTFKKPGSKPDPLFNLPWDDTKLNGNLENGKTSDIEDERCKVIESLGEVLKKVEKLEKLEANRKVEKLEASKKVNGSVNKPSPNKQKNGKAVYSLERHSNRKSKTLKSVWRKGNPVVTVPRIKQEPIKQEPMAIKQEPMAIKQEPLVRPPQKVKPKLQTRPSISPLPSIKTPVNLKDIKTASKPPDDSKTGLAVEKKERKPILIDKFASKKPPVDRLVAQAVFAPPIPEKGPITTFKEGFRKKSVPSGGPRRRKLDDDIADEDTSELGVSIPCAVTTRKGRKWSKAARKAARLQAAQDAAPVRVEIMEVDEDGMLTDELSHNLAVSEGEILGYLYSSKGIRPDGVQKLSKDMVKMICKEYEVEVIDAVPLRVEDMAKKKIILDDDDSEKLKDRPPVVTIMGHVDHGKTTLLDYIRNTKVAAGEAGGITQGIGAYKVQVPIDGNKQTCVFLDTPGHEAFGAMRARGARVTDIAVIVIAADDGIRPQTSEAIAHAKAAGVPIIVAINKIDKDGANPDRVIQDLSLIGLMPEEWGGDIPMVQISALKGKNVDDLLETIMLLAELQELKANPQRNAKGTVIEAGLDKSKGPIATFIVQNGTLRRGDILACGDAFGKVRALFDENGKRVDEACPSIPVQVIGLNNVPLAGDEFEVVGSLDIAREKAKSRAECLRDERIAEKAGDGKITLSSYASAVSSGDTAGLDLHQLNIILKVDVQGSTEAVRQALQVLPQDNITLKFLLQATGDVNASDVDLAVASKAIIFGFNVKTPGSVKSHADQKNVEIRLYKVIYELIDDVRKAMEGLLDPVEDEVPIGLAEVRAVFSSGSGRVGGCMVTEGKVVKGCGIRVLRKGKEVHVGVLSSLKRVKEIVKEVNAGLECGIGIEDFNDWEAGDAIEAFNTVQKNRTLEEASASISAALEKEGVQR